MQFARSLQEIACQNSKRQGHTFSGWIYMLMREGEEGGYIDAVFSKEFTMML